MTLQLSQLSPEQQLAVDLNTQQKHAEESAMNLRCMERGHRHWRIIARGRERDWLVCEDCHCTRSHKLARPRTEAEGFAP